MAFYDGTDNTSSFQISFTDNPGADFGVFARGYARAAGVLAKELLSRDRFADYEAYPVVFLYRHAFELYLKDIIYGMNMRAAFEAEKVDDSLKDRHRLDKLAYLARDLLRTAYPDDQDLHRALDSVVEHARDLSAIDAESYSFRYPTNKKGEHSTTPRLRVSLLALSSGMARLVEDLETLGFGAQIGRDKA